jgi:hypothetical protein
MPEPILVCISSHPSPSQWCTSYILPIDNTNITASQTDAQPYGGTMWHDDTKLPDPTDSIPQAEERGHESCGTRNRKWLKWWGPTRSQGSSCTTPRSVRRKDMVMSPAGPRTENDWNGEARHDLKGVVARLSEAWHGKIWSWVLRDSEEKMTEMMRPDTISRE